MAFALILWPFPSSAEELTDVCLKSGIQVRARIETREGRFILYIQGSSTPSDMTGQIHSVGVPDDPVCKQEGEKRKENQISQTTKFGIRGSNTIGERLMPMLIEAYANKNYGAPPSVRIIEPEHQEMEIKRPASAQPDVLIDF
jgi:phosphate transport system substrate-binding protein